jgi:hypothetical protein
MAVYSSYKRSVVLASRGPPLDSRCVSGSTDDLRDWGRSHRTFDCAAHLVATDLVEALRENGVRDVMIYDDDGNLRIQALGEQPPRLLPAPESGSLVGADSL